VRRPDRQDAPACSNLIGCVNLLVEIVDDHFGGVPRCTNAIPCADLKPGTNSAAVGRTGNTSERAVVVTANARSLPDLIYWIAPGNVTNMLGFVRQVDR
jgi:hypothetical protein